MTATPLMAMSVTDITVFLIRSALQSSNFFNSIDHISNPISATRGNTTILRAALINLIENPPDRFTLDKWRDIINSPKQFDKYLESKSNNQKKCQM